MFHFRDVSSFLSIAFFLLLVPIRFPELAIFTSRCKVSVGRLKTRIVRYLLICICICFDPKIGQNFQNFPNPNFINSPSPIIKLYSSLTNLIPNKFPIQTSLHSKIFFHFFNIFIYQTIKSKNYHTNIKQYFHIYSYFINQTLTIIYTSLFQINYYLKIKWDVSDVKVSEK